MALQIRGPRRAGVLAGALSLLFLSAAPSVLADAPLIIMYQGTLRQSGSAYTGNVTFQFNITDVSGSQYWTSGSTVVAVTNGLFRYPLGVDSSGNSGGLQVISWSGITPYVEVWANNTLLLPREPLVSVPYALWANSSSGLQGNPVSSSISPNPGQALVWNYDGNIGAYDWMPSDYVNDASWADNSGNANYANNASWADNAGNVNYASYAGYAYDGSISNANYANYAGYAYDGSVSYANSAGSAGSANGLQGYYMSVDGPGQYQVLTYDYQYDNNQGWTWGWFPESPQGGNATELQGYPVSSYYPSYGQALVWTYDWTIGTYDWMPSDYVNNANYASYAGYAYDGSVSYANNANYASWADNSGNANNASYASYAYGLQNYNVSSAQPGDGQVLMWSNNDWQWEPQSPTPNTITKNLQGNNVSATYPYDGQVLAWSENDGQWEPQYLTAADFAGGNIATPSVLLNSTTTPSSPVAGQIYFDGTHFQGYDGSNWKQLDN